LRLLLQAEPQDCEGRKCNDGLRFVDALGDDRHRVLQRGPAIVLTPAVYAATRAAGATPLPYLFVCAFIANAVSFVLPISNPANLVIFGAQMPDLAAWLAQFGPPSVISIGVTYLALRMTQRGALAQEKIAHELPRPQLTNGGRLTAFGIAAIALVLLCCSALNVQLGVSWGVLPLVAGLVVLVEALDHTGVIAVLNGKFHAAVANSITAAAWSAGLVVALASNLMKNLSVGADSWLRRFRRPTAFTDGRLDLIGVGPWPKLIGHRLARHHAAGLIARRDGGRGRRTVRH
jgi:Na+/H+ antiporter NhaD/arsenite permease-like protein